eukprot:FR740573.1.p1 GENE.FR740573.1~~FR740573.1.p1  ORF type:complete len:242 (+),score=3.08 FR740573.1:90-728(+)
MILQLQPEAFLIEQSASIHHKKIWNLYNGRFRRAGTMSSFNLSYHRVPQERHRLIMGSPALIEALKRGATTEKMGWGSAVNAHKQTALPKGALLKNTTDNTPTTTGDHPNRPLDLNSCTRGPHEPALTVCSGGVRVLYPSGLLQQGSVELCAVLQTFPLDVLSKLKKKVLWKKQPIAGSRLMRILGNAVPVEFARQMGMSMRHVLRERARVI